MKYLLFLAFCLPPLLSFGQVEFPTPVPAQSYKVEYWKIERHIRDGYPEFWEQNWYSDTVYGTSLRFYFSKDKQSVSVYDGPKFVARFSNRIEGYYYGMEDPMVIFKNKLYKVKITKL